MEIVGNVRMGLWVIVVVCMLLWPWKWRVNEPRRNGKIFSYHLLKMVMRVNGIGFIALSSLGCLSNTFWCGEEGTNIRQVISDFSRKSRGFASKKLSGRQMQTVLNSRRIDLYVNKIEGTLRLYLRLLYKCDLDSPLS